MTDPVCVEHAFGTGNDMFSGKPLVIESVMTRSNPRYTNQIEGVDSQVSIPDPPVRVDVTINLFAGYPVELEGAVDCYIINGFLKVLWDEGYDCWNVMDVQSYHVSPA